LHTLMTQPIISPVQWFRTPSGKNFLVTAGIIIGLFVLVNYIVLPLYVSHAGRVTVPPVVGMSRDSAVQVLELAGLRVVDAETRPDPTYPPGVVVQQNPLGEAVVKEGRRVYLTLSGGEVQVVVPSLRGRSLRDARFALERFGLKLGGVGYDTSDTFPENTIIAQSIQADAHVSRGTEVHITVSQGRSTSDIRVPLVIGKTLGEATKLIEEARLHVGTISYQQSFDLVPNTVVDQFPRPGETPAPGQGVDLFVVKTGRPNEEIEIPTN
jgi:beta-lactam-binding protein with PASTA domain